MRVLYNLADTGALGFLVFLAFAVLRVIDRLRER